MPMRCVFLGPLFWECPLGLYPAHSWEWSKLMKPYKWDECCCLPGLVDENLRNTGVIVGGSYTQHIGANWFELDMELF